MEAKKISQKELMMQFKQFLEEKGFDIQQELGLCLSDIPKTHMRKGTNGKIYVDVIVGYRKEPDQWGRDLKVYVKPTKEDRAEKRAKAYVGGGKTYIFAETNGSPVTDEDLNGIVDGVEKQKEGDLSF